MALFCIKRKYRKVGALKEKYNASNELMTYLDESITHLRTLEKIHLLNVNPHVSVEIDFLLNMRWAAIQAKLSKCLALTYGGKHRYVILSVQGGFDLYRQVQNDVLMHSSQGDKYAAQKLLNCQGQELSENIRKLLEGGKRSSAESFGVELKSAAQHDFTRMVYLMLVIVTGALLLVGRSALTF